MSYFLSVLQLLFLLITVSSKQCPHERSVIQVTGGIKERSQNGNHYGIITTPNFPNEFPTPFNVSYVIDASYRGNDTQIKVYLTQMFLNKKGVRFFQHSKFEFCDHDRVIPQKPGHRRDCTDWDDQKHSEIHVNDTHSLLAVSTTCPYLEIQVTLPELYGYHYRTRDPFLFHVYGFNVTFEIAEKLDLKNDSCNPTNCSNVGHCYLAENWRDFFCDCPKDHPGRYCEFISDYCNPANNITFCLNGGICKVVESGGGNCDCSGTGYNGTRCEKRNEQPKVSARTGCSNPNECPIEKSKPQCRSEPSKMPCSCSPIPKSEKQIPHDWRKFEAIISISPNYTLLVTQTSVGYELQQNITRMFRSKNLSDLHDVMVRFHPAEQENYHPRPEELQIHFYGPGGLRDTVRTLLKEYLFNDESLSFFRKQVPLLRNKYELYIMPRVEYKNIEGSKKLVIGKSINIACEAYTGSSDAITRRDIRFRWFKDNVPVNTSITTRHMAIYPPKRIDENVTSSIITIDQVTIYDGGIYTCEITDLEFGDRVCGELRVEVVLPPYIEIEPMSLTLERRKIDRGSKVIICTDGSYTSYALNNKTTTFMWSRKTTGGLSNILKNDDMVVVEDIIPQGKILRILKAEQSESFVCSGNSGGGEKSKTLHVKVLDSMNSPSCKQNWEPLLKPTEKENKLVWEWTAPSSVAMIPCPKGFIGYVQRPCIHQTTTGKVYWGRSDFSKCISHQLVRVNLTLQNAKKGFGDWEFCNSVTLMSQLNKYLNANQVLYPGEGEKILTIMADIVQYAFEQGHVNGVFFQVFFGTTVKLLKIPNSCVQEKSVLTLFQIIVDMAVRGAMLATVNMNDKPHIVASEVLMLQTLPINVEANYQDFSYTFPQKDALTNPSLAWLKDKLHLTFPWDSKGLRRDANSPIMYYLMMAAYRNVSSLLASNEVSFKRGTIVKRKNIQTSIELISPVVQISVPDGYYLLTGSHIKIQFNMSKEHRSLVTRLPMPYGEENNVRGTFYSCGKLDNSSIQTKADYERLRWTLEACVMDVQHNSYVECQCETLGIFGLLKVSNLEDKILEENKEIPRIIIAGFSLCILSCVLSATLICVYLECRLSLNSLYSLKLLDCLFIFSAVFIVLLGRTEVPSASWLVWSTAACSFLISSLDVQVTKALRVLLMEASSELPAFIFPWLRNVSPVTLLSVITFSTVLPVWTATAAKMIRESSSNESAFHETSHVFAIFVGTVGLVVISFLVIYYKAVLKTKRELDGCRQENAHAATNKFTSDMARMLAYRMKTLNRSLGHTLILLVAILGIVLYENLRQSIFIQYFSGLSVTAMGIFLLLSHVSHSEHPILANVCKLTQAEKPLRRDPERDISSDANGSQRKLYAISPEVQNGNGSIVGTTGLLPPPPPPAIRNACALLADESSVSTVEEQSMDTFSTEASFRQALPSSNHKVPMYNNRSVRSTGNNTKSSNGSRRSSRRNQSIYSSERTVPIRGTCLINSGDGDYILPSIRNTSINDRSTVQTESSGTSAGSNSNYNYVPIHDNDEIQRKISHDLSILLPHPGGHY